MISMLILTRCHTDVLDIERLALNKKKSDGWQPTRHQEQGPALRIEPTLGRIFQTDGWITTRLVVALVSLVCAELAELSLVAELWVEQSQRVGAGIRQQHAVEYQHAACRHE